MHNSELEKIQPMIKHEMENAFKLDVPLTVELGKIGSEAQEVFSD
jgi:DNA polymerase-1